MKQHMTDRELQRRIADLPREMQPQNDPWPAIAARIAPQQNGVGISWTRSALIVAAAASVVLMLFAVLLFVPHQAEIPVGPGEVLSDAPIEDADHPAYRFEAMLQVSQAEYLAALREFNTVGEARPNLSPETIRTIEDGWADLRETEAALMSAIAENPGDRFLHDRLLGLRARQIGFLWELAALDQSNRRLTI
jgi:hypothetical protein